MENLKIFGVKPVTVPICITKISNRETCFRIRAAKAKGWRLTKEVFGAKDVQSNCSPTREDKKI
jgi:hypothetical protein